MGRTALQARTDLREQRTKVRPGAYATFPPRGGVVPVTEGTGSPTTRGASRIVRKAWPRHLDENLAFVRGVGAKKDIHTPDDPAFLSDGSYKHHLQTKTRPNLLALYSGKPGVQALSTPLHEGTLSRMRPSM